MPAPNILLIITDQQRADYLGCAGHPVLKTPNIDAIAERGVRFERFYVANPICMPNRSSLMTGRMASLHGVRHNGIALDLEANTFVDLLKSAGYNTGLIGKSHLQNFAGNPPLMTGPKPKPGFGPPPAGLAEARKGVPGALDQGYDNEIPENWDIEPGFTVRTPFYGFDSVDLTTWHGDKVGGDYAWWLQEQTGDHRAMRGPDNALASDVVCPQAWRTALPEALYPTAYIGMRTAQWLERAAEDGRPFFAMCSFNDPHHPFTPPGKYWDMYDAADMVLPPSFQPADNRSIPPLAALWREYRDGTALRDSQALFVVDEREAREAMALTCGMITAIDDAVGVILNKLGALGLADNTVVMFTSDHGDFMGDHQLLLKGPLHFQSLIKVPFIWSDPAGPSGATTSNLSGTIDIARTVLERAGLEPYNGIQGRSLLAAACAKESDPPEAVLIEEDGQRTYMGFDAPVRARTLVTRRHRMTIYHGVAWGVLHDLEVDPHEMTNLWDDPGHAGVRSEMFERMARKQMELVDRSPLPTRAA